jgi:hypothetical protein
MLLRFLFFYDIYLCPYFWLIAEKPQKKVLPGAMVLPGMGGSALFTKLQQKQGDEENTTSPTEANRTNGGDDKITKEVEKLKTDSKVSVDDDDDDDDDDDVEVVDEDVGTVNTNHIAIDNDDI